MVSSHENSKMIETYVCDAGDANTLEFAPIEFFDCSLEIRSSLEFDKAPISVSISE
jgi:hypothetical protein